MTFAEAMTWFSATAAVIFSPFAIVEKFSSKDDAASTEIDIPHPVTFYFPHSVTFYLQSMLLTLPGLFLFDYINFTKTRFIIASVAKRRTVECITRGLFAEIILLFLLFSLVQILYYYSNFIIMYFDLFHSTMEEMLTNTADYILYINMITASLSTIIIILFVFATITSYFVNSISLLQDFVDKHTAVLEKPLQVVGAMVVCMFSALFWTWYSLSRLHT